MAADYIDFWKPNGFWFLNSPALICDVACEATVDLTTAKLAYYRGYARQYEADRGKWTGYNAHDNFRTDVLPPDPATLLDFDVVTYAMQNAPECSPLSCNHLATDVNVNEHCLID